MSKLLNDVLTEILANALTALVGLTLYLLYKTLRRRSLVVFLEYLVAVLEYRSFYPTFKYRQEVLWA
jgi:hypothetical protein